LKAGLQKKTEGDTDFETGVWDVTQKERVGTDNAHLKKRTYRRRRKQQKEKIGKGIKKKDK